MAKDKTKVEVIEDEVEIPTPKHLREEPNIAYVGDVEPFKFFNTATGRISLPEDQSKPFYHAQAKLIIQTWPLLYKPVTDKGA